MSGRKTDPVTRARAEQLTDIVLERLDRLDRAVDDARVAALHPRPVEVRHVHEQPPKPLSVQLNIISADGRTSTLTLMSGGHFDIPAHLVTVPAAEPARRWWQRKQPRGRVVTAAAPVRIELVGIR